MCIKPNNKYNISYSSTLLSRKVNYILDFYDTTDVHITHFEELKSTFFTSVHFALRVMN